MPLINLLISGTILRMSERSNKQHYLDFHETSDERITRGSLKEQQLQEISETFNEAFDEFILRHVEGIEVFDSLSRFRKANLRGSLSLDNEEYLV